MFVFFQAEDGIRGLVRSRGLGDVYKRQPLLQASKALNYDASAIHWRHFNEWTIVVSDGVVIVSYTHLTLPTSDLV